MGRQKYSFEFKKQVVSDYLNGKGGYGEPYKAYKFCLKQSNA